MSKKKQENQTANFTRLQEKLNAKKEQAKKAVELNIPDPEKQDQNKNIELQKVPVIEEKPSKVTATNTQNTRRKTRKRAVIKKDVPLSFLQPFDEAKKFDAFIYSNFQQYGKNNINKKRVVRALMRTIDIWLTEELIDDIYELIPHDLKDADQIVEELEKLIRLRFTKA